MFQRIKTLSRSVYAKFLLAMITSAMTMVVAASDLESYTMPVMFSGFDMTSLGLFFLGAMSLLVLRSRLGKA